MLEKEFNYFLNNQNDLVSKYNNKYLVIIGEQVKEVCKSHKEAYNKGKKKYGLGKFLIQHCIAGKSATTRVFHSQFVL